VQEVDTQIPNNYLERLQLLESLLEQEFSMLSARSFEQLPEIQKNKTDILLSLQKASSSDASFTGKLSEHSELAEKCRTLQLKNQILVVKQLQAVQGALDHLIYHGRQTASHTYENLR
jgi:flagellar biosynthesis/type III secretory pathway chaperone